MSVSDMSRAVWRKGSYSTNSGGNCIEVADLDASMKVRDSKDRGGPALTFSVEDWRAFINTL